MADSILTHVGDRIHLYRKNIGMSMEELAQKIHKSKASVSKYESGLIAVDVETLFNIAKALHVAPYHLLDYLPPSPADSPPQTGKNPLAQANRLYLYHMDRRAVHLSMLQLDTDETPARGTLFYKLADPEVPDLKEPCDCIYHGHMFSHDMILCFVLRNHYNPVENILLNFVIPMRKTDCLTGMISGLTVDPLAPAAHKMLLSTEPMAVDSALRTRLTIGSEAFREMKRGNKLFVPAQ